MPVPEKNAVHKRSLLRDDVYTSIRDAIVDGTFAPGERLRDTELEKWLGVSRTPIREALLRLERGGLVVSHPGKATLVAPHDPASTLGVQQVTAALHELAARLALPVVTAEQLSAMDEANARFAAALDAEDVDGALDADDDFHNVFITASGNETIAQVLGQLTPVLRRVERMRFSSHSGRESVPQHELIVKHARAGEIDEALVAVRENWLSLPHAAPEHND
ncbi:GntR family transcriptional regulator [Salinibacterium sp. NK8237]|uniref:GntR family transcriptional regulator n=1 Tax=Salinibacterium sp. NK8237 TaxID=2792038 RepID=UPI0018CDB2E7|nr:GntR family transcriptional regulator [Salinibacterium sp. NK8237]MBH0129314.1 GntR family transcriptional regulator [Salinibacterium sp. NK8237]